jgi:tetratricopeptide (TPR) repeat protein
MTSEQSKNDQIIQYLYLLILMIAAFMVGFFKIYNYDIWWHMKTGELILAKGIPRTDPFSFTSYGKPWITHEWLAEVLFYIIYSLGGLKLLVFLKGILAALTAAILYHFGIRRGVWAPLAAAAAFLALSGFSFRIFARPHLFTFIFLSILITILFKTAGSRGGVQGDRSFLRDRWVILPAVMFFWANMQAGFFIGLGIYWIVTLRELFFKPDTKINLAGRFKKYALPALFATFICLLNPNGIGLFTYPVVIAGNPLFKSTISEWVSPLYLGPDEWLAKSILAGMLILGVIAAIFHIRKRPDISLIILIGGAASLWAMRNVADYMIIAAAGILAVPALANIKITRLPNFARLLILLLSAFFIFVLFSLVRDYQAHKGRLGLEMKEGFLPDGAAGFLRQSGFHGNIVNTLQDGGYLIWTGYPEWRIFVDGRLDVYGADQIDNYRRVVDGLQGSMELLDQLNVGAVVIPMPPRMGAIRSQLAEDDRWKLVYFDNYYLVYVRNNETFQKIVAEYGYQTINPLKSGYQTSPDVDKDIFLNEAFRAWSEDSLSSLKNLIVGYACRLRDDFLSAARYYQKALELQPNLYNQYSQVGIMYLRAGLPDSARTWLEKATAYEPKNPWIYYYLGLIWLNENDLDKAEFYLNTADSLGLEKPAKEILERIRNRDKTGIDTIK